VFEIHLRILSLFIVKDFDVAIPKRYMPILANKMKKIHKKIFTSRKEPMTAQDHVKEPIQRGV